METQDIYTINETENELYYVIYKNGEYYTHISKKSDLNAIKQLFNIQ